MDFLEKFLLSIFAQKAIKSAATSLDKNSNRTNSYYRQLRTRYFSMGELSHSMLNDLFSREPDLIEGQTGPDCREFLHVKVSRYAYCGHMIYGDSWFTISANDRFIYYNMIWLEPSAASRGFYPSRAKATIRGATG